MNEDTYEKVLDALEDIEELEESGEIEKDLSKTEEVLTKQEKQIEPPKPKKKEELPKKKTQDNKQEIPIKKPSVSKKPKIQEKKQEKSDTMVEKTQEPKEKEKKQEKKPEGPSKEDKPKKKELVSKPAVPGGEVSPTPVLTTPSDPKSVTSTPSAAPIPAPTSASPKIIQMEAEIKILKDTNKEMTEKIEGFAERIGEIRGLVMERETIIREALISIKKINEVVSELEPMKMIKDKRKTRSEIIIIQSKQDEYEKIIKDLSKKFNKAKETIDAVTDIHTILEIGKDVGKRLQQVEEVRVKIDRMMHKMESIYAETNKKFEQLPILIGRVEKFDALSMEIMKILDEYKVKMEGFLVNQDLDSLRNNMSVIKEELQEVEQRATRRPISVNENKRLEEYKKMIDEELEAIRATNSILEEQYREAMISERTFNELMKKNRERQAALETLIKDVNSILEKGLVEDTRLKRLMQILKKLSKK